MNDFEINDLDIAIIGMAGRFPGAENINKFWQNLLNGICTISFFDDETLHTLGVDAHLLNDPNYVKAGGVLKDIKSFDAAFFNYPPREAELMDPQQRFLLECAWEALENAGYDSEQYPGLIGIYAGAGINTYLLFNIGSNHKLFESMSSDQVRLGNSNDFLATRISYKLGLEGPSVTVQTACSTSLVAVHLACQNLLNYQCDMALAGGVSINALHERGYLYREDGILSPDGYCRAFDAKAQGTVGGSGVGMVVLKRMSDAVADGDTIYAVIRGSAVNNDGASRAGFTAPREDGQAIAVATALAVADVEADTIGYVEGHGAGTILGDPIEIAALTQAFKTHTDRKGFCALGSVKTNVGHLDTAAGITGLIKTILILQNKRIPPSLHFQKPNANIDFEESPFYVNTELQEWETKDHPRRAGVSSFGQGGTNAHIILEEAPNKRASGPSRPWQLLLLSAKTDTALQTTADNLLNHLQQHPEQNLADVAYTLQIGRRTFNHRLFVVCKNREDAIHSLETRDTKYVLSHVREVRHRPVTFMFSGVGDHYANMGRDLYHSEPLFRETIDHCAHILQPLLGLDIRDVLYPAAESIPLPQSDTPEPTLWHMLRRDEEDVPSQSLLDQTRLIQPISFVVGYALAQMWLAWGIRPHAMIGYSIGEYVAACIAGVFSLEDALYIVAKRAQLIHESAANGSMLAVPLSKAEIAPYLNGDLSLAAVNTPSSCVVSGRVEAINALAQHLMRQETPSWQLPTTHAFHSSLMKPLQQPLTDLMASISLKPPQIRYLSNVTGEWITAEQATDPAYWATHLCQPVRFADAVPYLWQAPGQVLLELGPGHALCSLVLQHPVTNQLPHPVVLPSLRHAFSQQSDMAFLLKTVGQLWLAGVTIDWEAFYTDEQRHRIPLPTYPFERQKYWVEKSPQAAVDRYGKQPSAKRKPNTADWFYTPSWERTILPSVKKITTPPKWLLFVNDCPFSHHLITHIRHESENVVVIQSGTQFKKIREATYTLNPKEPKAFDYLFRELMAQDMMPTHIVHLWRLTSPEIAQTDPQLLDQAQHFGFYSLIYLAQTLDRQNVTDPIQIFVVANGLHNVIGQEALHPEKTTVLAPCKILPQEYPNLTCRSIDIVLPQAGSPQEQQLLTQLITEFKAEARERVIAYRSAFRWVQTFSPIPFDRHPEAPIHLRKNGVYFITGGLGKIGLVLAQYLAQSVQAKLILVGRSPFPGQEAWPDWLAEHDESDSISQKIKTLQAIEHLGAEVLLLQADVSHEEQLRLAITQTYERFGCLNGVFHLAGSVGQKAHRLIPQIGKKEYEWHFAPKVQALYALENVLDGHDYDFCFLASSISTILGGLGFTAYASANTFMDAFVHQHNRTHDVPWTSIIWEGWQFPDDLVTQFDGIGESIRQFSITPQEGMQILDYILSMPHLPAEIVTSTGSLAARIDKWTNWNAFQGPDSLTEDMPIQLYSRPNLNTPYVAPKNDLERGMAQIWQELLGLEKVGVNDNFFELGGNSLIGLQIIYKLRKQLKFSVPLTILYEGPTISTLSQLVANHE